jgi:hypothetical protein
MPLHPIFFGSLTLDATTVDQSIAHMVCYVDSGGPKSDYPKCDAYGLPGHTSEQCHSLINYFVAQATVTQHPEMVKWIKAAYKKFPGHVRSRTPKKATVNHIVAFLDLPTTEDMPVLDSNMPVSPADDFICHLDFDDPAQYHCKVGSSIVTYRDQDWCHADQPETTFAVTAAPLGTCAISTDALSNYHSVSLIQHGHDMLVDSGSTITTEGTCTGLKSYVTPSKSGVNMRSVMGQVAPSEGKDNYYCP